MVMSCHTEISGTVLRSNERGLVLTGRDGWLNISRYADGLVLPPAGTPCTVGLDKAGFIRAIATETAPTPAPAAPESTPAAASSPDRLQARTAALAAAVRLVLRRPGSADTGEVLAVSEQLFAWLLR